MQIRFLSAISVFTILALGASPTLARSDKNTAPANTAHWQRATETLIRSRSKLVYELTAIITQLNLDERATAQIDFRDKQGMEVLEAIRLLGQLHAEEVASTLSDYLYIQAPLTTAHLNIIFDKYPAAGALAQIGVASLDPLLLPDPSLPPPSKKDAAMESQLLAAIVAKVLGQKVGLAYLQERIAHQKPGKTRTRLENVTRYLKSHTELELLTRYQRNKR